MSRPFRTSFQRALSVATFALVAHSSAHAQVAADTSFAGSVSPSGAYTAVVPLDLPPTRDGLTLPFHVVYGGQRIGAAGVGWDVPLSYIRIDDSIVRRKPAHAEGTTLLRVTLSLDGQTTELVDTGAQNAAGQEIWVPRENGQMLTAVQQSAGWLLYDGTGHTYAFSTISHPYGMSLLQDIWSSEAHVAHFTYDIENVALPGGSGLSIDLSSIEYDYPSTAGDGKYRVALSYGADSPSPLSYSIVEHDIIARFHTLEQVDVRSNDETWTSLRSYSFAYATDGDTGLPRLASIQLFGRDGAGPAEPVAIYHYGTATGADGSLTYETSASISPPIIAASSLTASPTTPVGAGYLSSLRQAIVDVNGDGLPDLIIPSSTGTDEMVALNQRGSSFSAPTDLGDTATKVSEDVEESVSQSSDPWDPLWCPPGYQRALDRKLIDMNADGRVDIVDADENPGYWTIYLNTPNPGGASGISWQKRLIPVQSLMTEIENAGFTTGFDGNKFPIRGQITATDCTVPGSFIESFDTKTYTVWDLRDINGDGYPDFVFMGTPVPVWDYWTPTYGGWGSGSGYDGSDEMQTSGYSPPNTSAIYVNYNLAGIMLGTDGSDPVFAESPVTLSETESCAIDEWDSNLGASCYPPNDVFDETCDPQPPWNQHLVCTIADVNGDRIADRIAGSAVFVGTGEAFSNVSFTLPANPDVVLDYGSSTDFDALQQSGLRDLTGDGIPDLIVGSGGALQAYIGTGAGFRGPVPIVGWGHSAVVSTGHVNTTLSSTVSGIYDIDGDGRADILVAFGSAYDVYSLSTGTSSPQATGQLTAIDNGYGATVTIAYTSAKQDTLTQHDVPFPEPVVASTTIEDSASGSDILAPVLYAYGSAAMTYNSADQAFEFAGYQLTVSLQDSGTDGQGRVQGQATLVQRSAPVASAWSESNADRFKDIVLTGTLVNADTLAGELGSDPWALLATDPYEGDTVIERQWHAYDSRYADVAYSTDVDCLDVRDPYDWTTSKQYATDSGYSNDCLTHGFGYGSASYDFRGPISTGVYVQGAADVWATDDYGQPTRVWIHDNSGVLADSYCVDTSYATPAPPLNSPGAGYQVLSAIASQTVWLCDGQDHNQDPAQIFARDYYDYDTLANGSVGAGEMTEHRIERHTSDGTLLDTSTALDVTYDAVGNVATITQTRDQGSNAPARLTTIGYDVFGLAPTSVTTSAPGTSLSALQVSATLDGASLQPLSLTDENQSQITFSYDAFGRPIAKGFVAPTGDSTPSGGLSSTSYFGFSGDSNRYIVNTTYDQPVGSGSAVGHSSTTYFDSLGRELRTDVDLGSDYGQTVSTNYTVYDSLGHIAFTAFPFVSTDDPASAYGTSRFYEVDGTPLVFVDAFGHLAAPIWTSDDSTETYPTRYYHSFSGGLEYFGRSTPDANSTSAPQAGVETVAAFTAEGHVVDRFTTQGGVNLDYESLTNDVLGHMTATTRYRNPTAFTSPITRTNNYDSVGNLLGTTDDVSAPVVATYNNFKEPVTVGWIDGSDGVQHAIMDSYDAYGRLTHSEEQAGGSADPATTFDYAYDTMSVVSPEVTQANVLGRLSEAASPTGSVYFSYDAFGATSAQVHFDGSGTRYVERYVVRLDGNTTSLKFNLPDDDYVDEEVDYGYDSASRPASISYTSPSGTVDLFEANEIDAFGHLLDANYGAEHYTAEYAASGRMLLQNASATILAGGPFGNHLYGRSIAYTAYDAIGRELSRTETKNNVLNTYYYTTETYDPLGRLATYTNTDGPVSWQDGYDPTGDVTSLTVDDADGSDAEGARLGYGSATDEICYVAYAGAPHLCFAGHCVCNVFHDDAGNVVSEPTRDGSTRTMSYFASGLIRSISQDGNTAAFRYDALGEVQELDVASTTDPRADRNYGALISITNATTSPLITRRIPGPGGAVASIRGSDTGTDGSWVFAFADARGTRSTTDQHGNILQDVGYQPFGEASSSGADWTDATYTKEQWNSGDNLAAFNLVQLGARIYEPVIGRFLSRDPLTLQSTATRTNPYAFADNDPVNLSDPTGLCVFNGKFIDVGNGSYDTQPCQIYDPSQPGTWDNVPGTAGVVDLTPRPSRLSIIQHRETWGQRFNRWSYMLPVVGGVRNVLDGNGKLGWSRLGIDVLSLLDPVAIAGDVGMAGGADILAGDAVSGRAPGMLARDAAAEGLAGAGTGRVIALDSNAFFNLSTVRSLLPTGDELIVTHNVVRELAKYGVSLEDLASAGIRVVPESPIGATVPATFAARLLRLPGEDPSAANDALNLVEAAAAGADSYITKDGRVLDVFGGTNTLPGTDGLSLTVEDY